MRTHSKNLGSRVKKALSVKIPEGYSYSRIGSNNDGGYVAVNDFTPDDYLVSFGIADNVDFEKEISPIVNGIDMYDFSIQRPREHVDKSRFYMERIGAEAKHIFDRVSDKKDLILKIDIEGSEWDFFENISEDHINRFRQIILEIHWMIENSQIYVPDCRIDIIEKINRTHQIVAVHPNNWGSVVEIEGVIVPTVLELTLLRKKDYVFVDGTPPGYLFSKNNPNLPDIEGYL